MQSGPPQIAQPRRVPPPLMVRARDKLLPDARLRVRLACGVLPYDHQDNVARDIALGRFETGELALIARALPACRGFVDVGANLGLYTLLADRLMGEGGRVFAFEASPIEFAKLQWTIRRNRLTRVEAVLSAVGSSEGSATIFENLSGGGALNRLDSPAKPDGQWRPAVVPMVTLDSWFAKKPDCAIDFVKIDVEGYELPVLQGAQELLAHKRPALMVEMNEARASAASHPQAVWDFLLEQGYRWYGLGPDAGLHPLASWRGEALNLFAVPGEAPSACAARLLGGIQ